MEVDAASNNALNPRITRSDVCAHDTGEGVVIGDGDSAILQLGSTPYKLVRMACST
jgi:hypothetical protein